MYSDKPQNWYFQTMMEPENLVIDASVFIALSPYSTHMDDEVIADELPQNIKNLLSSVGVYTETETAEGVFDVMIKNPTEEKLKEFNLKLIGLGFNEVSFTP